jgi:hypothetical protein
MLHQPHPAVLRPALLVVVADDVLVVGVGVFGEVALDELTGFVLGEFEDDVESVDVAHVDADRVFGLELEGFVEHEFVGVLGGAGELAGAVQAENEQVEDQAVELEDEAGELQALDNPVIIGVVHILEINNHIILRRHILGYIMIHNQPQEPTQKQQINLLIHLIQLRLEQHQRLPLTHIPHPMQIINPLTELIHK